MPKKNLESKLIKMTSGCKVLVALVTLQLVSIASFEECPPWTTPHVSTEGNTTHCMCQGGRSLGKVECRNDTLQISVIRCYCITYNKQLEKLLVGRCLATCSFDFRQHHSGIYNTLRTSNSEMINKEVCLNVSREGQLCGNCIEGYGPPVYSYSLQCVKCDKSNFKYNLLKYIAVAFLPLTGFYLIVIVFKIRVTSSSMVAYVLTSQLFTAPFPSRYILRTLETSHHNVLAFKSLIAFLAIWNLDIFRSMYSPFCIHPDMTTLQVLALDYFVGVYPLALIAITYMAVLLHDRYPLIVRLWRPVNKLCMYIRREWDIRGSLVQAFATFLVLSNVKILNVSFDLLTPVYLMTPEGDYLNHSYLYNAGETPCFGPEHLPYGILAVFMLAVFNVLPVVLLFLYPCSCCHKCLNSCHLSRPALHIFMDAFQGCYYHKPRERRYFAALYFVVRYVQLLIFFFFKDILSYSIVTVIYFLSLGLLVIIFKPYKKGIENTRDASLFLWHAFGYLLMISYIADPQQYRFVPTVSFATFIAVLLIYILAIMTRKIIPRKMVTKLKSWSFQGVQPTHLLIDPENEYLLPTN